MSVQPNQIEKLLAELLKVKQDMEDCKLILKDYKIQSDRLRQLKSANKELKDQINEEIDRIEAEFYEDKTFEETNNKLLTLKNQKKEKAAELRQVMSVVDINQQLSTYDYNIKGEKVKMQVERKATVYINGKEEK